MGLNMNVYGVKHERLWGNVRCDHTTPTFPDFNMNVYGKIRLKCVFMGKGSEFACQTPASDAEIKGFGV